MRRRCSQIGFVLFCVMLVAAQHPAQADPPRDDYEGDHILVPGFRVKLLIGPFAGFDYNIHDGTFVTTDGGVTCCQFDGGTGFGAVGGVRAFIPYGRVFRLSPRLLYERRDGRFDATSQEYPFFGSGNGVETVELANRLDATLGTATLDLFAAVMIPSTPLYVAVGPSMSLLVQEHYVKTERITGPPGVHYLGGSTEQVVFDGNFALANTATFTLRAGGGAILHVSGPLYVNPELLYVLPLGPISDKGTNQWESSAIQATVGVLFAP